MTRTPIVRSPTGNDARLKRGVRYIERNIESRVSLAEVASEAALSEYHFHRLFRSRFGIPVMDYVRRRKLARAAQRLIATSESIIEIALDAGFESQSAFTRAFRRMFRATPGAYRAQNRHVPWLSVEAISDATLACLPGLGISSPRLEHTDEIRIAGLTSTYAGDARAAIPDQWMRLAALTGRERFLAGERFGVSDATPHVGKGTFHYTAGIALASAGAETAGLMPLTIPGGRYAVFDFGGPIAKFPAAIDYLYGVWMPGSDHALRLAPGFERYPKGFIPKDKDEFEIWLPVE